MPDNNDVGELESGSWSPQGDFYVFAALRENREDLWVLFSQERFFGSAPAAPLRLTHGPLSLFAPQVAEDGTRIFALGTLTSGELMKLDRRTGQFQPYFDGLSATSADFSSDGRNVAYASYPDGALWRMGINGTGGQRLVGPTAGMDGVAWSPDRRWIAFRSRLGGAHMKIYLIPSGGGQPEPITEADEEQGIPTWSPDSTRLVFGDVPIKFGIANGHEALHVYDIVDQAFSVLPGAQGLWTPRWSPDGKWIAALTIAGQSLRIFDVARQTWRALSADQVNEPSWSRDSRELYYDTVMPGHVLRSVRISDGHIDTLADLAKLPVQGTSWSGLAPDDTPLGPRRIGAAEVYALTIER